MIKYSMCFFTGPAPAGMFLYENRRKDTIFKIIFRQSTIRTNDAIRSGSCSGLGLEIKLILAQDCWVIKAFTYLFMDV